MRETATVSLQIAFSYCMIHSCSYAPGLDIHDEISDSSSEIDLDHLFNINHKSDHNSTESRDDHAKTSRTVDVLMMSDVNGALCNI